MKLKEKISNELNSHEGFVILKKLWQNKRYRSIFWLLLYFIFFAVIISSIRTSYNESPVKEPIATNLNVVEVLNSMNEYSYEIFLNKEQSIITGEVKDNTHTFTYQNKTYTIVANNIYLEQNGNLIKVDLSKELHIPIEAIALDKLDDYIVDKDSIKTTDSVQYNLENISNNGDEPFNLGIIFYGKDTIEKIEIDFSDYVKNKNLDYEQYLFTIKLGDEKDDSNSIG